MFFFNMGFLYGSLELWVLQGYNSIFRYPVVFVRFVLSSLRPVAHYNVHHCSTTFGKRLRILFLPVNSVLHREHDDLVRERGEDLERDRRARNQNDRRRKHVAFRLLAAALRSLVDPDWLRARPKIRRFERKSEKIGRISEQPRRRNSASFRKRP